MKEFVIYTDGSYDMDSHYGASAIVILDKAEQKLLYKRASARLVHPTEEKQQFSQEQELGACIRAVMSVPIGSWITIKTDSQYCAKVLAGEWEAHSNLLLVDRFFEEKRKRRLTVNFVKVRGHSGDMWNDFADALCLEATDSLRNGGSHIVQTRNLALE